MTQHNHKLIPSTVTFLVPPPQPDCAQSAPTILYINTVTLYFYTPAHHSHTYFLQMQLLFYLSYIPALFIYLSSVINVTFRKPLI
jgi:hypothetical protein